MKKRITALLTAALLTAALVCPAAAAEDGEEKTTIHIASIDQLNMLAENCILKEYSTELRVVLDKDLDMEGQPFFPIPSFSGSFDGGGHTISNFSPATDGSHQGFFRYLEDGGEIHDLKLEGRVNTGNERSQVGGLVGTSHGDIRDCSFTGEVSGLNYVGGLVGENYGLMERCSFQGTVNGKRFTGGIAGYSAGVIIDCENYAQVNTSITAGSLEFDSITLNTLTGLSLTGAEDTDVVSDSGGVVGFSIGVIDGCENMGKVGYPHYGYNVGGIAGRHSGYITNCVNRGEVCGRQDVAGIVGQMEPYLLLIDSATLAEEVALLQAMIDATLSQADGQVAEMEAALYSMRMNAGSAADDFYVDSNGTTNGSGGTNSSTTGGGTTTGGTESGTAGGTEGGAQAGGLANRLRGGFTVLLSRYKFADYRAKRLSSTNPGQAAADAAQSAINNNRNNQSLRTDLSYMGEDMERFSSAMGNMSGGLSENLSGVSAQFAKVMLMITNALNGNAIMNKYNDVSKDEPEDSIQGKVSGCVNYGAVEGDTNVGGIAGAMGIEYQFDMENQIMSLFTASDIISTTYESKCIARDDVNRGTISARKDHAGGVAGNCDVGIIDGCQGYGSVASAEGSYVGGVVGLSQTVVQGCYSMCRLDGEEYVGGIAGYGTEIQNCAAIVGLGDVTACFGAIAGWADITDDDDVSGNRYVGEHMGAVDNISYGGKAESVSYRQLLETEGLPESFGMLKLSFVADGVTVAELPFEYGGSIDESALPEVPAKEGFNGSWEDYDYSKLYYADVVEAQYSNLNAALSADEYREGSPQPIVLAEGEFPDGAKLRLNKYSGDGPEDTAGEVLEKWVMTVEGSGSDKSYTIHYLEPEHTMRTGVVSLYSFDGQSWSKLVTTDDGSYLLFDWQGDSAVFCAVETARDISAYIYAGAGVALLVASGFVLSAVKKRRAASVLKSSAAGDTRDDSDTITVDK